MKNANSVVDKNGAQLGTNCPNLTLANSGKVREIYEVEDRLLMVTTDRISAYDVVMGEGISGKGRGLTSLSLFWFDFLKDIVPNHLITADVDKFPAVCHPYREQLEGRSMLVKKAEPLPIECIVRGYISGSFWEAYQKNTTVCGFKLPEGMQESEKFPQVMFTPSTKAEQGLHDENISYERMEEILGKELAGKVRDICIRLYERAAYYARAKGIIIADTKFELGMYEGELILIDEVLTPDSSRFWPVDEYRVGQGQPSFDKQLLRDWLSKQDWDKTSPAPALPDEIVGGICRRYLDAKRLLLG